MKNYAERSQELFLVLNVEAEIGRFSLISKGHTPLQIFGFPQGCTYLSGVMKGDRH